MSPKYTKYELELRALTDDGKKVIALLAAHLPQRYNTRADVNTKRRAIGELFGEHVKVEVVSVRRIPARTIRRKLKV